MQLPVTPLARRLLSFSVVEFFLVLATLCALADCGFAQAQLSTYLQDGFAESTVLRTQTSQTTASLSDSYSSLYTSEIMEAAFGSARLYLSINLPIRHENYTTGVYIKSKWRELITINNPGHEGEYGPVQFTMHLTGGMTCSAEGRGFSSGSLVIDGAAHYESRVNHDEAGYSPSYTNPSSLGTFTAEVYCFYGQPFPLEFELFMGGGALSVGDQSGTPGPGGARFAGDFTLKRGNFVVFNEQGQLQNFTAQSNTGSSKGTNIAAGGALGGFTLTNSTPGRIGTTMSVRDGVASIAQNVRAAFIAPPDPADMKLASDAVDFSGTGGDLFVIQMNYDPSAAQTLSLAESALRLAWRNPANNKWLNAVMGNVSDGPSHFFARAYSSATDFKLGNYGVDTINHVVWAVLNHNSEFGVGVVPDPVFQKILSLTRPNASTIRLQCLGMPNVLNRIESSPDLSPGSFTTLTSAMADANGAFQFDDAQASGAKKFYRLAFP
jgi:hypothetical protein